MLPRQTIIIGDVHGMLKELKMLLEHLSYNANKDRCILCGDLVDRGPDSNGVIRFAKENGLELVIGNHDDKYIQYKKYAIDKTANIEVAFSTEQQKVWDSLGKEEIEYLENGSYFLELLELNAFVVHAGLVPSDKKLNQRERKEYLLTRYIDKNTYERRRLPADFTKPPNSIHWTDLYDGTVDIIYGHDIYSFDKPAIRKSPSGGRTIGIDTGAVYGGHLTAIVYDKNGQERFVKVKAEKAWKRFSLTRPLR